MPKPIWRCVLSCHPDADGSEPARLNTSSHIKNSIPVKTEMLFFLIQETNGSLYNILPDGLSLRIQKPPALPIPLSISHPLFSHKRTPSGSVLLRPSCPHAALPAESRRLQTVCGTPYCLPEYANRYSSDEVLEKPRKPASLPHPVHSLCPGTFSKS